MQQETFWEYINRKIKKQKGDYKNKILFSQRVLYNLRRLNPILRIRDKFAYYTNRLDLLQNALADNGLGLLELRLHNAHIPTQYFDIFYKLPTITKSRFDNIDSNNLKADSQIGGGYKH
ncbi:hypothetical protein CCY99_04690 [Helicobacter sp. 16-1353]|uniref:hypothetical protein n=1 Tax=Helicobacter sp. 16-1353 TaxID=2004996 RepID=UPI000DCDB735|nr:hypothetical protein [Helicobacter sp. 16-1353]RAX53986.1 hypothetical protein CCY99_04690 [Helicobacter sp. 16-1353]